MGNLVFNERLKLRANFANNLGIALLLAIAIAPMVATDHGLPLWQEVTVDSFWLRAGTPVSPARSVLFERTSGGLRLVCAKPPD